MNLLEIEGKQVIVSTDKIWDILPGMFMLEELGIKKLVVNGVTIYTNTINLDKILISHKKHLLWWKK